ncbi:seipin [Ochlerotatus camptorhynchus]|uniref:seipin n=1 Tax=Ochlerotatus camptorhynchus TaxID=644619 RepID=UPI0031E4387B
MQLGSLILTILDPFEIIRKYLLKPLAVTGIVYAEEYKRKTNAGVQSTKNILLKLIAAVLVGVSIVWASIFMYAYFYYSYMPTVSHVKEVYLNYRDCQPNQKCYEYPSDTVILTNKQQILMVGQAYRVTLYLEMPESTQNDKTGMFTVCATMQDRDASEHSIKSCRLSMLHFKSNLLKMIYTVVMAPFFILGYREEKQMVAIDLFTHFEDSQAHPVTSVDIAVLSKEIQFYSAQLHITANFSGLRYLMFNWPIMSAMIGILTNLFFILMVCVLSWYHWDDTEWLVDIKDRYQQILKSSPLNAIEQASTVPKAVPEDDDKPENIEDVSSFKDDLGLTT